MDLEDVESVAESSHSQSNHSTLRGTSSSSSALTMPKSTRSASGKGKAKSSAASTSKQKADNDIEMSDPHGLEIDSHVDETMSDDCADMGGIHDGDDDDSYDRHVEEEHDDEGDHDPEGDHSHDEDDDMDMGDTAGAPPGAGAIDDSSLFAMFGDYRQLGSFMMSLSSRLKTMLNNIKITADPTTRLIALQELSELLSISTEDTLAGSFPIEQFVRELVRVLGGKGIDGDSGEDDGDGQAHEQSEDASLAAALAMSTGNVYQGDENPEAQVLACRCLANLMEALPGVAHTVVYHGAIPVLCSKLTEISYIDLAEQTLSTLEKISEEFPSSIVREGGLSALLGFLDFFSIAVQRTAMQAAANCCRNVSSESFPMIQSVWVTIRNCLSYSDQRIVEYACLCVIRVIDSYHRSSTDLLEKLIDIDLIRSINMLLLPSGGSPLIATNTYTLLIRALATSARASPVVMITLLKADLVDTLYQILTGVLPPCNVAAEQGGADGSQGLGGGIADMAVMDNLAHRPKDQVEETLSLISELMPPQLKDGVFDHKNYTEKALSRMVKAKGKAERAATRQAAHAAHAALSASLNDAGLIVAADLSSTATSAQGEPNTSATGTNTPAPEDDTGTSLPAGQPAAAPKESPPDRITLLQSEPPVTKRFLQLMVPILVDVYAASVSTSLRMKALTSILKAVSFLDEEGLNLVLKSVPIAGFASSVLSSKDHPNLVIGVLQLVDILLAKVSTIFKPTFKREGVFYEINEMASRETTSAKKEKEKEKEKDTPEPTPTDAPPAVPSAVPPLAGLKKLTSISLEPEDAVTLRARVIRFKYLSEPSEQESDHISESLRQIVEQLSSIDAKADSISESLRQLAQLFASPHTSVSSFELLQSGLVDSLLKFASTESPEMSSSRRREIFAQAFSIAASPGKGTASSASPMATFVKKLQESLTRMESFNVITVSQSSDDTKRSSPSLLARQLRLRLVADADSDIPRNLQSLVVSIHAIATFQALHDYLRPRVSGLFSDSPRLSSMLAALAASGLSSAASSHLAALSAPPARNAEAPTLEDTPSTSASAPPTRRRSKRLSNKSTNSAADAERNPVEDTQVPSAEAATPAVAGPSSSSSEPAVQAAPEPIDDDADFEAAFTEDEMDPDVFDHADDGPEPESTISVSVNEDGSKVVAQTPQGTRVATPGVPGPSAAKPPGARPSYASALKSKPTDWHLEFSIDDQPLPLDLTIYGAVHHSESRKKSSLPPSLLWQGVYTVKFKKVAGPAPSADSRDGSESSFKSRSSHPELTSLPAEASHTKILNLLRLLHRLNSDEADAGIRRSNEEKLPETAFINNKLTAKLTRQLEEPMIVASSCLPDWALDLPQHFPFLFPFATRYSFLQSTSFGYARLILKWQSQQSRGQDNSRRDDGIGFLGRLQRQKVRISRNHLLESAVKVFELYGSSSSILEVEYFEEVGTGLGPTLEFYSLVSKEFVRRDLKIWQDSDTSQPGVYVYHPQGLYPSPMPLEKVAKDDRQKRKHLLSVIGQFVAKAMLDSRIVDLSFNTVFLKHVLGEEVPATIATLQLVDSALANSLVKLEAMASQELSGAAVQGGGVEDLAIDFTIPGYDIELKHDGAQTQVTAENSAEYIRLVLDAIVGEGIKIQAKAFREGFSKVFSVDDLQAFSAEELAMLFGNAEEDWSIDTLGEAMKADHGFTTESPAIRNLVDIMTTYDTKSRRDFLQFITGSPKLPIGGFRGLNPPLTVVKKPHEAPLTADDYLPSVMTCVNYLKLPNYSSKESLKEKLRVAMIEGVGSFHLS